MECIDTARLWRVPSEPEVARQRSCKTFYCRDLASGEVLTGFDGQPLAPQLQRVGPGDDTQVRRMRTRL
jgi:hypothetical protein